MHSPHPGMQGYCVHGAAFGSCIFCDKWAWGTHCQPHVYRYTYVRYSNSAKKMWQNYQFSYHYIISPNRSRSKVKHEQTSIDYRLKGHSLELLALPACLALLASLAYPALVQVQGLLRSKDRTPSAVPADAHTWGRAA
jgi:hypothetical protein